MHITSPNMNLPNKAQDIISSGPLTTPSLPEKPKPELREFGDPLATRKFIYDNVIDAARNIAPLEDDKHILRLSNVDWMDPEHFSRKQRKQAVLTGETIARRMKGTWELADKLTGDVIQQRNQVVARVPYLSSMGTFIHKGNEYSTNNQQRLLPGIFARIKENGELESHVNVLPGKGLSHRYFLDPEKGVFKIHVAQAEMPLMPLLKAMGTTDREFRDAWGDELWQTNYAKNDASVLTKLKNKFLRKADLQDESNSTQKLIDTFNRMELNPEVTKRTLGHPYANVTKEAILAATNKLLKVSKGEVEPDDRDHLAYQKIYGPEDLFAERIARDHGNVRKAAFKKISMARSLDKMPSGLLTSQLEQVLLGSGLAQAIEEISPLETLDKQTKITRMGEGGISGEDAIPDESRQVSGSHMGFIDSVRTPESGRVGVDLYMTRGARKSKDGQVYTQLLDKNGNKVLKSPQDIADASLATLEVMKWDTKRVPVMKGGKVTYIPKDEIDYVLPDFENAFSPLANMVPLKSMSKGQRVAMGSRYLTQALPLKDAQAPFVQNATPESKGLRSFEEEYGQHMGSVVADQDGRVEDISDGIVKLRHADGSTKEIELYKNYPFNRKTTIHQTPLIQPGQTFKKGQPLVKSNYTDDNGTTALGTNLRVAYMPWHGQNFEDAQVISESAAKKLSSESMYQHELEVTDKHKIGKKAYISLFPTKFKRDMLGKLDDDGIIKVGQTVKFNEPMIIAAKERDSAQNKVHKKKQAGYSDDSILWKHHDPGIITDVVWGKNGPVVVAKSTSAMQVGDKMSGRWGDKSIVSAIIPDHKMPHDKDGKPYEVLLNPLGVITRCYDAKTEFLTMSGWKFGKNILPGEILLCFEPTENLIYWYKQLAPIHIADYSGNMLHCINDRVDFVVTPNHKVWTSRDTRFDNSSDTTDWYETTAEEVSKKSHIIPVPYRNRSIYVTELEPVDTTSVLPEHWHTEEYSGKIYCPSVPTGYVVSRRCDKMVCLGNTNPSQMAEAFLGKIAEKTGKPYKVSDFDDEKDMSKWVQEELKKHGMTSTEDIIDPEFGNKVPNVATGNRFIMKLSHVAESKAQGRGSGNYSMDETPARGGEAGCFTGDAKIRTWDWYEKKYITIKEIVENKYDMRNIMWQIPGEELRLPQCGEVTDWFQYRVLPEELLTVTLANENRISCTKNHEFILSDGTRKLAKDLQVNDDLQEII